MLEVYFYQKHFQKFTYKMLPVKVCSFFLFGLGSPLNLPSGPIIYMRYHLGYLFSRGGGGGVNIFKKSANLDWRF